MQYIVVKQLIRFLLSTPLTAAEQHVFVRSSRAVLWGLTYQHARPKERSLQRLTSTPDQRSGLSRDIDLDQHEFMVADGV